MDAEQKQQTTNRKLLFLQELLSDKRTSEADVVLNFFDDASKAAAFEHYWQKLQGFQAGVDLDALRVCVRLLPPPIGNEVLSYEKLQAFIAVSILNEPEDPERIYKLAQICLSNPHLGHELFFGQLYPYISAIAIGLRDGNEEAISYKNETLSRNEHVRRTAACLHFLKCSFWLPSNQNHLIQPLLLDLLVSLVDQDGLADVSLDALSALLSLLDRKEPIVVAQPHGQTQPWLSLNTKTNQSTLRRPFINQALWGKLQKLKVEFVLSKSGKLFRTWFQWISLAADDNVEPEGIYQALYWERLRLGLLTGFSDQRKYCLGIIHHSLMLARKDITTPSMTLKIGQRTEYVKQYEKFSTLFEMVVLDRYTNQVQACLPDLSSLFGSGSLISPALVTALLSAALNPTVQDGVRKLIGNWYIKYSIEEKGAIEHHAKFLTEGFLPWATQGSLFTTSLISTRTCTICTHGTALTDVIAKLVTTMPSASEREQLLSGVLLFILNAGGKMFQPSIPYMLEGLLQGLKTSPISLQCNDITTIIRVSRLTGLPEIANDLYTVLCAQLCEVVAAKPSVLQETPGYQALSERFNILQSNPSDDITSGSPMGQLSVNDLPPLQSLVKQLNNSQHKIIQRNGFAPFCKSFIEVLNINIPESSEYSDLYGILDALWEEADRQEYFRPVAVNIPAVFFHPSCVHACIQQSQKGDDNNLVMLMEKVMEKLQQLSEGRSYLLSILAKTLRKAAFLYPDILNVLPFEDFLVRFINTPPSPKKEFLFEVAAAEELEKYIPHRDYAAYYGQREWHAYAAIVDLLNRFPKDNLDVAKRVLRRVLEPWTSQKLPVPIISKWKDVFQLQAMLVLTESCVDDSEVDTFLDSFMRILVLEQWPRYRFVIEWIISRIYNRFPSKAEWILVNLRNLDESSPIHIASLIKLSLLVAPFLDSEDFALKFMNQLVPFSASPKIHIRHESLWVFPSIFHLAEEKHWSSIINNPAFCALNNHVRKMEKYNAPPSTIRTLKLDAVNSFNITEIFQGQYLFIETPEQQRVAQEDFLSLYEQDKPTGTEPPEPRIRLTNQDSNSTTSPTNPPPKDLTPTDTETITTPAPSFLQTKTKTTTSPYTLLPTPGPPSTHTTRPTPLLLIASLIDNPTNLGGLSRISESFGVHTLYIDSLAKTTHKDFKATSVTSEKHLPIKELKVTDVPGFLVGLKREGYVVVGIEQTDRSGVLGEDSAKRSNGGDVSTGANGKGGGRGNDVGTLPRKCALVLGSEKGGISSQVLAVVDRCVEIKTVGVTRSLNVQTAGGIAIYEWWREWGGEV